MTKESGQFRGEESACATRACFSEQKVYAVTHGVVSALTNCGRFERTVNQRSVQDSQVGHNYGQTESFRLHSFLPLYMFHPLSSLPNSPFSIKTV